MTTKRSDNETPRTDNYERSEQVDLEIEILASEIAAQEEDEKEEASPKVDRPPEGPPAP